MSNDTKHPKEHCADNQCVHVHASRVKSARLLNDSHGGGDFVAIRLEATSQVQHWAKYRRILSVESRGAAIVYLEPKDAAALRDQITKALEEGELSDD